MHSSNLLYTIGVSLIPGVGCITAKKLIAYIGSVEGIFKEKKAALMKVPGIGEILAIEISKSNVLAQAEEEIAFIEKYNIKASCYFDKDYPSRLKLCPDAPLVLFIKGNIDLENQKVISIVGTRNATDYGKSFCENLIESMAQKKHNAIIVSGLAYGIDIAAHKAALKHKLETVACLAHGLKSIYPKTHDKYAREIIQNGALVTEFTSTTTVDRAYFVRRNRIIAGLADATIVVESGQKGGSLITAEFANSYNRDVFAVPGPIDRDSSKGCNKLIKINKASLLENVEDLEYMLGWESKKTAVQRKLFADDPDEQKIIDTIRTYGELPIDLLCSYADLPANKISPILLNMEFSGIVKSLPGKMYKLL